YVTELALAVASIQTSRSQENVLCRERHRAEERRDQLNVRRPARVHPAKCTFCVRGLPLDEVVRGVLGEVVDVAPMNDVVEAVTVDERGECPNPDVALGHGRRP